MPGGIVKNVQCKACKEYKTQYFEKKISDSWIQDLKNPTSDGVKKHFAYEIHKPTADLPLKKELRPKQDPKTIRHNIPIRNYITRTN